MLTISMYKLKLQLLHCTTNHKEDSATLIQGKIKYLLDMTFERSPYIKDNLYQSQSQRYT